MLTERERDQQQRWDRQFGEENDRMVTPAERQPLLGRPEAVPTEGEADIEVFPDGGRGWLVVLGTFLALNASFGMSSSYGIYQLNYQKKFPDVSASAISLIGALQPFMIYLSSIPTVSLINMVGVKYTVAIGYMIMITSLTLIPSCETIQQLYLCQGIMFGFGAGILYFIAMSIPSEWFKEKRATAIGLTSCGASFGGVIWPTVLQYLTTTVGFARANQVVALSYLPLMACSTMMINTRFPNKRNSALPKFDVLREKKFVVILLANSIGIFGHFAPLFYVASFADRSKQISPHMASIVLVVMNAFSGVGRTIPSFVADKVGRLNMLILCVFLTGFSQYAFWLPAHSDWSLAAFAVTWGIGSGAFTALYPPTMGQLFGIEDNQSRLSFFFFASTLGSVFGPVIFGSLLEDEPSGVSSYPTAILFSGGAMLTASFILIALRLKYSTKLRVFI